MNAIDIRSGGKRVSQHNVKSDLASKLKAYERRHSLSQTSSKKTGKPNSVVIPEVKGLPNKTVERFKPKKASNKTEWEVIFAYYSPRYPYKTLKLRFNADDFLSAGREAKKIKAMLSRGGDYKDSEIIIIALGMTGAMEAHLSIKPKN